MIRGETQLVLISTEEVPATFLRAIQQAQLQITTGRITDVEEFIEQLEPDLFVLYGVRGAVELSTLLDDDQLPYKPRLVIVAPGRELSKLRGLNREIVVGLLTEELPYPAIARKLLAFARSSSRAKQDLPDSANLRRSTPPLRAPEPSPLPAPATPLPPLAAPPGPPRAAVSRAPQITPPLPEPTPPAAPLAELSDTAFEALENLLSPEASERTPPPLPPIHHTAARAKTPTPPPLPVTSPAEEAPEPPPLDHAPPPDHEGAPQKPSARSTDLQAPRSPSPLVSPGIVAGPRKSSVYSPLVSAHTPRPPSPQPLTKDPQEVELTPESREPESLEPESLEPESLDSESLELESLESEPLSSGALEEEPWDQEEEPTTAELARELPLVGEPIASAAFSPRGEHFSQTTTPQSDGLTPAPAAPTLSPPQPELAPETIRSVTRSSHKGLWIGLGAALCGATLFFVLQKQSATSNEASALSDAKRTPAEPHAEAPPAPTPSSTGATPAPESAAEQAEAPAAPSNPPPGTASPFLVEEAKLPSCEDLLPTPPAPGRDPVAEASQQWKQAGQALVRGALSEAHQKMCLAVALHPESAALEGLALFALRSDAPQAALQWLERAQAVRPADREGQLLHGDILSFLGQTDRSLELQLQALGLSAEDTSRRRGSAAHYLQTGRNHLKQGDLFSAERLLRRAVHLDPLSPVALTALAETSLKKNRLPAAQYFAEQALQVMETYPEAHLISGDIARAQEDLPGAQKHYERALALRPDFWVATLRLRELAASE